MIEEIKNAIKLGIIGISTGLFFIVISIYFLINGFDKNSIIYNYPDNVKMTFIIINIIISITLIIFCSIQLYLAIKKKGVKNEINN